MWASRGKWKHEELLEGYWDYIIQTRDYYDAWTKEAAVRMDRMDRFKCFGGKLDFWRIGYGGDKKQIRDKLTGA